MYRRAIASICFVIGVFAASSGSAQPSPLPTVTAESEPWYLSGEPLTYEGNFYYPRGAAVHFDRGEMVRSGFYRGIPLYARTTLEPYSVVFVPLAGGMLQPYERLRTGLPGPADVTGTARTAGAASAGPGGMPAPVGTSGAVVAPRPAATSGRVVVLPRPRPVASVARPSGANGMFVEFRNARWFADGAPVEYDASRFTRIGDYHGRAVFARSGDDRVIYIPTTANVTGLLATYSRR